MSRPQLTHGFPKDIFLSCLSLSEAHCLLGCGHGVTQLVNRLHKGRVVSAFSMALVCGSQGSMGRWTHTTKPSSLLLSLKLSSPPAPFQSLGLCLTCQRSLC